MDAPHGIGIRDKITGKFIDSHGDWRRVFDSVEDAQAYIDYLCLGRPNDLEVAPHPAPEPYIWIPIDDE